MADAGIAALVAERESPSFPVQEMSHLLYGGEQAFEAHARMAALVEQDPAFSKRRRHFMSRTEAYEESLRKSRHFHEVATEKHLSPHERDLLRVYVDEQLPISLHYVMFIPTIEGQGTEEQKEKWLPLARSHRILGTYAQTELGHGSFIRGIEMTATFDPATQEFVLNSPTVTSTKWWPGCLGKTSTHAVVMARLLTQGVDRGVHAFIVQLRSLEDHRSLPGIEVGDIGAKLGYVTNDNGFLRLHHARIPRENMLMRYATVAPDGAYSRPPHDKLVYGTMIFVRSYMMLDAARCLGRAVCISVRYSSVRRQFARVDGDSGEEVVLNYSTQRETLMPLLAAAYAFFIGGNRVRGLFTALQGDLKRGDLSRLPEVHATCAGLKAVCSWIAADGIEACRRACGGHGYSRFSGICALLEDYVPACSYEGENVVMCQQTARFLVKAARAQAEGDDSHGVPYLGQTFRDSAHAAHEWMDSPGPALAALAGRAKHLVVAGAARLEREIQGGVSPLQAWDTARSLLVSGAVAHTEWVAAKMFADGADGAAPPVLRRMATLFACWLAKRAGAELTEAGLATAASMGALREAVVGLCAAIRPDAVPLVDAFAFSDHLLGSALGKWDGDVYRAMYEWAKEAPLNETDVPPGYEEHLRPMLRGEPRAKL